MKLCINCWYCRSEDRGEWATTYYVCVALRNECSPVDGEMLGPIDCDIMRMSDLCGKEAKLFEQKTEDKIQYLHRDKHGK